MATIFSYFRLILFLGGVLVGVQVPVFVHQYGNTLEAHFKESQSSLHEFQNNAREYFGGDMEALIAHYQKNGDPVFQEGGKSIQSIYARFIELKKAVADFRESVWNAYAQAIIYPLSDIRKEVLDHYAYAVKLDFGAILFGLVSGFVLAVFGELALRGLISALLSVNRRLQPGLGRS
jgi:hypothetical protein